MCCCDLTLCDVDLHLLELGENKYMVWLKGSKPGEV